jgi:hypothetical protein
MTRTVAEDGSGDEKWHLSPLMLVMPPQALVGCIRTPASPRQDDAVSSICGAMGTCRTAKVLFGLRI